MKYILHMAVVKSEIILTRAIKITALGKLDQTDWTGWQNGWVDDGYN